MNPDKVKETEMLETIHAHFIQKELDGKIVLLKTYKSIWNGMADKELDNAKMVPINHGFFTPIGKAQDQSLYYPFFQLQTLDQWIDSHQIDRDYTQKAFGLAKQIIQIIAQLHKSKILHGAINPHHLLIDHKDQIHLSEWTFLTDAKKPRLLEKERYLSAGVINYIAPEQTGRYNVRPGYYTDMYAVGATLYKLFTGQVPFEGNDTMGIIYKHLTFEPIAAYERNPFMGKALSGVIAGLLNKDPQKRVMGAEAAMFAMDKAFLIFEKGDLEDELELVSGIEQQHFILTHHLPSIFENKEAYFLNHYHQASEGGECFLFFVEGVKGSGKQYAVNHFCERVANRKNLVVDAIFFKDDPVPYDAFKHILDQITKYYLSQSQEELDVFIISCKENLGTASNILIDICPDLKQIIPYAKQYKEEGPLELQNQLIYAFATFLKTFLEMDKRLIICLRDIHHAAPPVLKIIQGFLNEFPTTRINFIFTYENHKLSQEQVTYIHKWQNIEEPGFVKAKINLLPLTSIQTIQLLSLSGLCEKDLEPTTAILLPKTSGLVNLIDKACEKMVETGALSFDFEQGNWRLNKELANTTNINFNNPASYYEVLIAKLTNEELILLTYAAAFGNTFWFEVVKSAIKNERLAINLLDQLLHKGILMPAGKPGFYAFSEMELASFLLRNSPDASLQEIYLSIISAYINIPETSEIEEEFFVLLDKLLNVPAKYCKPYEQMLWKGIERAQKIALFEVNFRCYRHLIEMLHQSDWQNHSDEIIALYMEYIKAASLVLKFDICESTYQFLRQKELTPLQLGNLGYCYANALFVQQDFRKSIQVIAEILHVLNVNISTQPSLSVIIFSMIRLQKEMRGKDMAFIEQLPTVSDNVALVKIKLLQNAMGAAYLYAPKMIPELTSKQLSLSIKSGASDLFGPCLACYGFILSMYSNKPKEAQKFYEIAVIMNERFSDSVAIATTEFLYATFIGINHLSWKQCSDRLYDNYIFSRQIGQINIAFFSLITHFSNRFYAESNLEKMLESMAEILPIVAANKQQNALEFLEILRAFTQDLMGDKFPEQPIVQHLPNLSNLKEKALLNLEYTALNHIHILEEMHDFFSGNYVVDRKRVKLMLTMKAQLGFVNSFVVHHFFIALKILKLERSLQFWEHRFVSSTIKLMQTLAKQQTDNHIAKSWLLKGMLAARKKQIAPTIFYLQKAFDTAIKYEQYMTAGIATKELAVCYQKQSMLSLEKTYIRQAHTQFNFWGAKLIVRQLEKEHPFLLTGKEGHAIQRLHVALDNDFQSFIKASNSIASEINLEKLLSKLVNVLIENAAAENAFFIIPESNGQFVIYASKKGLDTVHTEQIYASKRNLPLSIVQYVYRTRQALLLNNAYNEAAYKNDYYIQNNQVRSLLCLPVLKNNSVQGLILLENNFLNQAFTHERTEIVKLLASQIAVSFENATLYNNVEQKIIQRTSELQIEKEKSEELLLNILPSEIAEELKNKGSTEAKQFEQVTVLFTDFVDFTKLSEQYGPKELVEELDFCFRKFDHITTQFGLEKIKTIGDAYLAVCGLPHEEKKHAEKVLEAALAIQQFIIENKRLKKAASKLFFDVRIGISSGNVVAGIVGSKKFAYDIWGDTVNTASRMVENSEVNKINISGNTYAYIKDYFDCEYRGKILAKNKGFIDMYFVNDFFLLEKIKHRVFLRMIDLDQRLHYHTIWHTSDVLLQTERIAHSEGVVNERELLLLKIAALYHDIGFLQSFSNHEEASCSIFMEDAEIMAYELTINEKEIICQLIMATKIPQEPQNLFEQIICDADLDYLGRDDFWLIGKKLYTEFYSYGIIQDEYDWNMLQLSFIEKHHYWTETSKKLRANKKAEYLSAIQGKLNK
jgi:class 3 adenylate cyclase/predicted ATPase